MTETDGNEQLQGARLGVVMAIYLLGLLIGGLYVGMVSPVRTVIQESFCIGDTQGIWMINIYTLFYAALIPVIGKLADRHGRKLIFALCLACFALGALLCGLSDSFRSFPLLLVGRVVQAVGACGMIPVANAEMGTAFPADKRGMALGLAAAVAGLANVLGSAVGSALLGWLGNANWAWLFFGCIPLCLVLGAAALLWLPQNTAPVKGKLDLLGSVLFVGFVLCLLMALRELDFFDASSLADPRLWGFAAAAVVLALAFGFTEKRAQDPVFHMEYFQSRPIVVTMAVSFFIGCAMISMTLIPQLAEVLMDAPTGSGGYYVAIIGAFSLVGPIIAGKLVDRKGPKPVLLSGLAVEACGFLFLAFVATAHPSVLTLVVGLGIVGLGMGFSVGSPTNYMILENVDKSQSTSAVSTIALVRQIGTTLAPAILVGFIANNASAVFGYRNMMMCVAIFCLAAAALMLLYHSPKKR